MLSQGFALLGALVIAGCMMAAMIECPAVALVVAVAPMFAVLGCAYVCGDERRLARLYSLEYREAEYDGMKQAPPNQGGNQRWWEDG